MKLDKKQNRLAPRPQGALEDSRARGESPEHSPHAAAHLCAGSRCRRRQGACVGIDAGSRRTQGRQEHGGNVEAAAIVGARIAEKAKAAGIDTVAFDRSGFRYHGRVKALADAAREAGLKF